MARSHAIEDLEHMAGQSDEKTQQTNTTPEAGGPWGAAGGGAVVEFADLLHCVGRPCARNPLWR
eukprot:5276187-Heterocapsa_arctica.AAC.1